MKIYIATAEPFHDNSTIIGVFATLEAAKAAFPPVFHTPVVWRKDSLSSRWVTNARESAAYETWLADTFEINLVEVEAVPLRDSNKTRGDAYNRVLILRTGALHDTTKEYLQGLLDYLRDFTKDIELELITTYGGSTAGTKLI